jgi:UDP:flavonoid glycosyltransferase YjiC (YdhE family)
MRSPEYYEVILDIYEEFPFELMIADITFGAIPFVKDKMNIPVIGISVVPLPETSKDLPPSGLGLTPSYTFLGRMKQHLLRFIADHLLFAKPTKVMRRLFAEHGIDAGNANVFDILIRKSTVVLQSGTPGFEYTRTDMSPHIHFAGPLLPYVSSAKGERWKSEKLKKYRKVILVTQGTVEKDTSKLIIPALEAFRNTDMLVIVTTGGAQTAELKESYPDENFIIEDFIPFADVLPFADVYVSNGGYGGVLLSIGHGVPMVVAGMHEGKNEINARVGYFGLGINLGTEKPDAIQLKQAVGAVIQDETYSLRVNRLRQEFRQYEPGRITAKHVARLLKQNRRTEKALRVEEEFIY